MSPVLSLFIASGLAISGLFGLKILEIRSGQRTWSRVVFRNTDKGVRILIYKIRKSWREVLQSLKYGLQQFQVQTQKMRLRLHDRIIDLANIVRGKSGKRKKEINDL
jgi:hypothetical protein